MRVQCVLCDDIHTLEDFSIQAKKLRNKPIRTYMCDSCHERITTLTNERIATGRFKLYKSSHATEHDF